jgi:hypothetical protein
MPKLKINLFGESWKLKRLEIDQKSIIEIAERCKSLNVNVGSALIDFSFWEELKNPKIKSIENIAFYEIGGLMNNRQCQIEFWFNGKRKLKLNLNNLFRPSTLFDLYNTRNTEIKKKDLEPGIYIIDNEIGLIASYELEIEDFRIDDISFNLISYIDDNTKTEVLTNLFYRNVLLELKRSDLLLKKTDGFIIN